MGGKGTRFSDAGYKINKACIPTTDRHSGKKLPMVICAMKDIPGIHDPKNKIICVDRDFHEHNGTEQIIRDFFPNTTFIHDHVLLDQAYGCFLAREFLQTDDELFIGACDNGMIFDAEEFRQARLEADVLMISHSNDDNIVAVIDGVVYAKKHKGHPRNPLRWREDGTRITGYLDREKRLAYSKKYYELKPCEFCGKELQIQNYKRHYASSKCKILKELKEANEKIVKLEAITN